jgi:hypothetical protein
VGGYRHVSTAQGMHLGSRNRPLGEDGDTQLGGANRRGGATPASVSGWYNTRGRKRVTPTTSLPCDGALRLLPGDGKAAAEWSCGGDTARVLRAAALRSSG